jgi:hypothetical protein
MSVFPKVIYKLNIILIWIPFSYFVEIDIDLEIHMWAIIPSTQEVEIEDKGGSQPRQKLARPYFINNPSMVVHIYIRS